MGADGAAAVLTAKSIRLRLFRGCMGEQAGHLVCAPTKMGASTGGAADKRPPIARYPQCPQEGFDCSWRRDSKRRRGRGGGGARDDEPGQSYQNSCAVNLQPFLVTLHIRRSLHWTFRGRKIIAREPLAKKPFPGHEAHRRPSPLQTPSWCRRPQVFSTGGNFPLAERRVRGTRTRIQVDRADGKSWAVESTGRWPQIGGWAMEKSSSIESDLVGHGSQGNIDSADTAEKSSRLGKR